MIFKSSYYFQELCWAGRVQNLDTCIIRQWDLVLQSVGLDVQQTIIESVNINCQKNQVVDKELLIKSNDPTRMWSFPEEKQYNLLSGTITFVGEIVGVLKRLCRADKLTSSKRRYPEILLLLSVFVYREKFKFLWNRRRVKP